MRISERFRGFLPVVVDLETGGLDPERNPILELACSFLDYEDENLVPHKSFSWDVKPQPNLEIDPSSQLLTGIDPLSDIENRTDEKVAIKSFFKEVRKETKTKGCTRAVLVAHNSVFDNSFLNAAIERHQIKRSPFHPFTTFDTATLGGVAFGHTVLREACQRADIAYDEQSAHRASYDCEVTALLFCKIVNLWHNAKIGRNSFYPDSGENLSQL